MASKKALAKAYDAGQAAQLHGLDAEEACPFEPGSEEHAAYMEGNQAELADKWRLGGGQALSQELGN